MLPSILLIISLCLFPIIIRKSLLKVSQKHLKESFRKRLPTLTIKDRLLLNFSLKNCHPFKLPPIPSTLGKSISKVRKAGTSGSKMAPKKLYRSVSRLMINNQLNRTRRVRLFQVEEKQLLSWPSAKTLLVTSRHRSSM